MKNIKLEDEQYIKDLWAYIFLNIYSCNQFELMTEAVVWDYCPLCMEDRAEDGVIKHKTEDLLYN